MLANTASTAAVICGERAVAYLLELGLPGRLVARDGAVTHLNGWLPANRAGDQR